MTQTQHRHTSGPYISGHGSRSVFHGAITKENYAAVAEIVRIVLLGKRYTWVSVNEYFSHRPEVRVGLVVASVTVNEYGFTVHDDYGIACVNWGYETQQEARAARQTDDASLHKHSWIDIKEDAVQVEHFALAGNHIWWHWAVDRDVKVEHQRSQDDGWKERRFVTGWEGYR